MFKFSCFHANVQGNKAKKTVQPSTEAMVKALQDGSKNHIYKDSSNSTSTISSLSKEQARKQMNVVENRKFTKLGALKKSQSLESGLYKGTTEVDEDLGFSCSSSKSHYANPSDQCKKNSSFEFQVTSGLANDGSLFSIGDPTPSDKDAHEISDTPLSGELGGDSADRTSAPGTPSLVKSRSLPNIKASIPSSGKYAFKHASSMSRSSDDLHALGMRQKEVSINESDDQIRKDQERENNIGKTEDGHMDRYFDDGFDSYLHSGLEKDWDFKIKRIEDWVTGLQHCGPPLEETNELPESVDPSVDVTTVNGVSAAGMDQKITPGMEAAKRYISSLSANANGAQLANYGLVVIPFLSAFVSLKMLNLAGNTIVRITAGSLPRGLHTLNLSRNNISTIEGLRELTRLRVLDLSYNRILRIGHGLASCSSLKELYLAGNKIGEANLQPTIIHCKLSTWKGNPCQKNVGDEQLRKYLQGLLPHLVYYNRQAMKVSTLKDGADRSVRLGMNSQQFDRSLRVDRKATRKGSHGVIAGRRPSSTASYAHRSQSGDSLKLSKGRQAHLPPIRTKASTQTRYPFDAPSKVLTSGHSMRKSRSEGTLEAL
ncbi:Leucine-rich repeat [Sesbania bispinosa]|nr:Leucine-rich repeat [Sesbania bispinosa]